MQGERGTPDTQDTQDSAGESPLAKLRRRFGAPGGPAADGDAVRVTPEQAGPPAAEQPRQDEGRSWPEDAAAAARGSPPPPPRGAGEAVARTHGARLDSPAEPPQPGAATRGACGPPVTSVTPPGSTRRGPKPLPPETLPMGSAAEAAPATMPAPPPTAPAQAGPDEGDEWPPVIRWPMDWEQEYRVERATLRQRLRRCADPEVAAVLRGLIDARPPASEAEWMSLGAAWRDAEVSLRERGRLPTCPWPASSA